MSTETNGGTNATESKPTDQQTQKTQAEQIQYQKEIRVHKEDDPNIVSVPYGGKYLQGKVVEVDNEKKQIKIDNYARGVVNIPLNDLVYKFFPGQKFDLREIQSNIIRKGQKTSIKESLNKFLGGTKIGNLDNLIKNKNHERELMALLSGKLSPLVESSSVIKVKAKDENGNLLKDENGKYIETRESEVKNWAAKFYIHRNSEGELNLNVEFKRQELDHTIYGVPLTEEQKQQLQTSVKDTNAVGQEYMYEPVIVAEGRRKNGEKFPVFVKLDKELNKYITFPYNERTAKRLMAKNERLGITSSQKQGQTEKQKQAEKHTEKVKTAPKLTPPAPKNENKTKMKL